MKLSNFSKLSFGIGALGKDLCYVHYFVFLNDLFYRYDRIDTAFCR